MKRTKLLYISTPSKIRRLLLQSNGWIVGGAIYDLLEGKIPKDWDIIITNRELFQQMCQIYSDYFQKFNSWGGIKLNIDGIDVDIWCEELGHYLTNTNRLTTIFNLRKQVLLEYNEVNK